MIQKKNFDAIIGLIVKTNRLESVIVEQNREINELKQTVDSIVKVLHYSFKVEGLKDGE